MVRQVGSALRVACVRDDAEEVQLLLSINADAALQPDVKLRVSPLHLAALVGNSQIIRMMMKELSTSDTLEKEPLEVCKLAQGITDTVELLQYIVSGCLADFHFHQSLGNEFMRRQRYTDAKISYDMYIRLLMQKVEATRVEDIEPPVWCSNCGRRVHGHYYKCTQCDWNCDLCESCVKASLHEHGTEYLIRVPSDDFLVNHDD